MQNAPGEHFAILSTFIKLPFSIKTFVLSILSGRFRQDFVICDITETYQNIIYWPKYMYINTTHWM